MSHIKIILAKIKNFRNTYEKDLVIVIVIVMVALISFGLGRLSKIEERKTPIVIENQQQTTKQPTTVNQNQLSGAGFVASKNGTKYHYPWCSGAQSIKEENKIWFSTTEEARQAGYTPASNCKGLK